MTWPSPLNETALSVEAMCESGLILANEEFKQIKFFQDYRSDVVLEGNMNSYQDLVASLGYQLPYNLFLRGYPTYNVPLAQTLNSFPPQHHEKISGESKT